MKDRLYYKDVYIKSFETEILKQADDENGTPYVVLGQTAFYPTGGGQPSDIGDLNGHPVTQVEEVDGEIRHYLESPLQHEDQHVMGIIDWDRRFDHMQQHAGQHILSAAFADLFDYQTVSFHLGKDRVTLDLATSEVASSELDQAKKKANDIVIQNLPIQPQWVDQDELSQFPLRKMPKVTENIRLVIIEGIDYNACGGTHPKHTGEVGPIHILGTERMKDKTRISFICGIRAIDAFSKKQAILQQLSHTLMRPEEALVYSVDHLLEEQKRLNECLDETKAKLIKYEAAELLEKAVVLQNGEKLICHYFIDRPVEELQQLAHAVKDAVPHSIILFTLLEGDKLQLIAARGQEIDLNMNHLIKDVLPLINGRGGGKPDHVQGGGEARMTASALLEHLKQSLVGKESLI